MTDRHIAYVVTLERDLREDDSADLITAISLLRGVAQVKPVVSEPSVAAIAVQRRDNEWRNALLKMDQP